MLQRRMKIGEVFAFRHRTTGQVVARAKVIEIRIGDNGPTSVIFGFETAPDLDIGLDAPRAEDSIPVKSAT